MSNDTDIDKAYFSPFDIFLFEFDENHEKTLSQRIEIDKHKRLARIRDDKNYQKDVNTIWEEF